MHTVALLGGDPTSQKDDTRCNSMVPPSLRYTHASFIPDGGCLEIKELRGAFPLGVETLFHLWEEAFFFQDARIETSPRRQRVRRS